MAPEYWTFVDTIDKTSVGKFDKKVLRAQHAVLDRPALVAADALAVERQRVGSHQRLRGHGDRVQYAVDALGRELAHLVGQAAEVLLIGDVERDGGRHLLRETLGDPVDEAEPLGDAGDDHLGAGIDERVQRRQRREDTARVGDRRPVERDVEIRPDQHTPARNTFVQKVFQSGNTHEALTPKVVGGWSERLADETDEVDEAADVLRI